MTLLVALWEPSGYDAFCMRFFDVHVASCIVGRQSFICTFKVVSTFERHPTRGPAPPGAYVCGHTSHTYLITSASTLQSTFISASTSLTQTHKSHLQHAISLHSLCIRVLFLEDRHTPRSAQRICHSFLRRPPQFCQHECCRAQAHCATETAIPALKLHPVHTQKKHRPPLWSSNLDCHRRRAREMPTPAEALRSQPHPAS